MSTSSGGEAKRKIQENNFAFDDLPDNRNDFSIWNRLLDAPYNLSVPELSALKNDRCPLPDNRTLPTCKKSVPSIVVLQFHPYYAKLL